MIATYFSEVDKKALWWISVYAKIAGPRPQAGNRGSGRGSRLAGFDALFNMGSARCKIEWNDNFEATYLKN